MIKWGIIGCGDVTEIKSGPAFNKVKDSQLVAVMRRDKDKARDYAVRHGVPKWYSDAAQLINDSEVNAIYVATPPSTHEEFTLAAFNAGKPVYVEKPMSSTAASAKRMAIAAAANQIKLVVAHYRNAQPFFNKVKELLLSNAIGTIRFVQSELYKKSLNAKDLQDPKSAWRVNPLIAGGGLFHDLAPHQFGLMHYFFGEAESVAGVSLQQNSVYDADDLVAGNISFKNGVLFNGIWSFAIAPHCEKDECVIYGEQGTISFSYFNPHRITLLIGGRASYFDFEPLQHVQQPMIERTVQYFLDKAPNPCTGEEGALAMEWIERFVQK